jgi:hypothetical protein
MISAHVSLNAAGWHIGAEAAAEMFKPDRWQVQELKSFPPSATETGDVSEKADFAAPSAAGGATANRRATKKLATKVSTAHALT